MKKILKLIIVFALFFNVCNIKSYAYTDIVESILNNEELLEQVFESDRQAEMVKVYNNKCDVSHICIENKIDDKELSYTSIYNYEKAKQMLEVINECDFKFGNIYQDYIPKEGRKYISLKIMVEAKIIKKDGKLGNYFFPITKFDIYTDTGDIYVVQYDYGPPTVRGATFPIEGSRRDMHVGKVKNINKLSSYIDDFAAREGKVYDSYYTNAEQTKANNTNTSSSYTNATYTVSSWARNEVLDAANKGIIPSKLKNDLTENITRGEFCYIAYEVLYTNAGIRAGSSNVTFSDTSDSKIKYIASLGIVEGTGRGEFDPNRYITREEAAKMLYLTALKLGASENSNSSSIRYADDSKISSWAKPYVRGVSFLNIMNGIENNKFGPKGNYSKEQAVATFNRLFNNYL